MMLVLFQAGLVVALVALAAFFTLVIHEHVTRRTQRRRAYNYFAARDRRQALREYAELTAAQSGDRRAS